MNILAIDTASDFCCISLFTKKNIHCTQIKNVSSIHNENILPMIQNILQTNNLNLENIELLAYGLGPGSIRGISITTIVVNTISSIYKTKILEFSSIYAIAMNISKRIKKSRIIIVLYANNNNVYLGMYKFKNQIDLNINANRQEFYVNLNNIETIIKNKMKYYIYFDKKITKININNFSNSNTFIYKDMYTNTSLIKNYLLFIYKILKKKSLFHNNSKKLVQEKLYINYDLSL